MLVGTLVNQLLIAARNRSRQRDRVPRQNQPMTEPGDLSDADLRERALAWREQALQGALHAGGYAHEYETEIRRRARPLTTSSAELDGTDSHGDGKAHHQ